MAASRKTMLPVSPGFRCRFRMLVKSDLAVLCIVYDAGIVVIAAKLGKIMHVGTGFRRALFDWGTKNHKKAFGVKIFLLFLHRKMARQLFCRGKFLLSSVG